MPTLWERFARDLETIRASFAETDGELQQLVQSTSEGVEKVTDGAFSLELDLRVEDETGRTYELHVVALDEEDRKDLGRFIVPASGYPISLGHTDEDGSFTVSRLAGSKDLIDYFLALIEPDSAVMKFLAYKLRNASPGDTPQGDAPPSAV